MDCKQVDQLLVDYLYQELEPALVEPVEAHLKSCTRCAEDLQSFERTRAMVGALEDQEPPPVIGQFLIEEARRAVPAAHPSWLERLRQLLRLTVMHPALAAAATLVAVLGVSFYVYREGLPTDRQPRSDLPLSVAQDHRATIGEASPMDTEAAEAAGRPAGAMARQKEKVPAAGEGRPAETEEADRGGRELRTMVGDNRVGTGARFKDDDGYAGKLEGVRRPARRPRPVAKRRARRKAPVPRYDEPYEQPKKSAVAAVAPEPSVSEDKKGPAVQTAPKAPPPRQEVQAQSQALRRGLRQQTRRAANISDTGSGGSAVWGNKYRAGRTSAASNRERNADYLDTDDEAQGALGGLKLGKGKAAPAKPRSTATKSSRQRSARVEALIVAGARAAKARRCDEAFQYYSAALKADGRALSAIVDGLGPCLTQLRGKQQKRFPALAKRVSVERTRRAKRAAEKAVRAAPATDRPAAVESAK